MLAVPSFYQSLLLYATTDMPLAGKEPSLLATLCFSITNAIFKRVDIGIFSLHEVQYRPERFFCVSLLIGEKASSNGRIQFYQEKQESN